MDVWGERTWWSQSTFTVNEVAKILGVEPATINQLLSRGTFVSPDFRQGRHNCWSMERIYRFIFAERPQLADRVPRLFPRVQKPRPATFLGSLRVILPGAGTAFVVYRWSPGDEAGGEVCLAYPVANAGDTDSYRLVRQLHAALGYPPGAVAVCNGEVIRGYPRLLVFDGRDPDYMPEDNVKGAVIYDWHELSALLRVDLPWWPPAVRHERAMLAWRPGAAAVHLRPWTADLDPRPLLEVIDDSTPDVVRGALLQMVAELEYRLRFPFDFLETAGFVHGGCDIGNQDVVPAWTWDQAIAVMHHHVESPSAAAAVVDLINPSPAAHYIFVVTEDECEGSAMAREWVRGLEKHLKPVELGHLKAARRAGRTPIGYYANHENDRDCWAAVDQFGTVYATVGTRVPAQGRLESAEVLSTEAAFFRDSDGRVWPIPHQDSNSFNAGYGGGGPAELSRAIHLLSEDASADVHSRVAAGANPRLWALISNQKLPLTIGPGLFPSP